MQIYCPKETELESSLQFHQLMVDAMSMSYSVYGRVRDAFPAKVDAIASLELRLKKYKETGNTEHLVDVANYAMFEFMYPKKEGAHYKPTDSKASPGRKWIDKVFPSKKRNKEEP